MTAIFFYFKLWNILLCQVMKWTFYLLGFINKKTNEHVFDRDLKHLRHKFPTSSPLKTLEPNLNNLNLIVTVWIVLTLRENSCANTSLSHLTCITRRLVFTSKVRATLLAPKKKSNLREEQKRGAPCALTSFSTLAYNLQIYVFILITSLALNTLSVLRVLHGYTKSVVRIPCLILGHSSFYTHLVRSPQSTRNQS